MSVSLPTLLAAVTNPNTITNPAHAGNSGPILTWYKCLAPGTDVVTLECFGIVFQRFVYAAFMFAGITAAILIALAGTRFILAEGDAKKIDSARHTITYAITGLIIIFLVGLIISTIAYITGVRCIGDVLPGFTNCADKPQ